MPKLWLWLPHLTSLGLYSCRGVGPFEGIAEQQLGLSLSCPGLNLWQVFSFFDLRKQGDRCLQDRGSSEEKAEKMQ